MAKVKFTTNIDGKLLKDIKVRAIEEDKNVNEIIEKLLKDYLNKEERNMKFYYGTLEFSLEDLENIETTDNYGNIDIGFEVNGRRFLILDIPFEDSDIDEAGDDFTEEFYETAIFDAIDNNRIEEIKD